MVRVLMKHLEERVIYRLYEYAAISMVAEIVAVAYFKLPPLDGTTERKGMDWTGQKCSSHISLNVFCS